jgi:hypothetical protein
MKTFVKLQTAVCAVALLLPSMRGFAGDSGISSKPVKCDAVADAVAAAVKKDPRKVLVVVEDFMVQDEACAAAIVKAAIDASQADADMRKQIAITATHIAPDMAKVIEDTVAALAPGDAGSVAAAVQKEAGSESTQTTAQTTTADNSNSSTGGNDYNLPADLRGVFFIEPLNTGGGAVTTSSTSGSSSSSASGKAKAHVATVAQNNPPNHPAPLSPSSGSP